jgi:hypothetical protein
MTTEDLKKGGKQGQEELDSSKEDSAGTWSRFPELGDAACNDSMESLLAFDEQLVATRKARVR